MTDLEKAARKLCEAIEFDMNGRDGRGGNGGLLSDATLRACHEVQAILNQGPDVFQIGDRTMALVFTPAGLTDVSNLQKVFDAIEAALSAMDEERQKPTLRLTHSDDAAVDSFAKAMKAKLAKKRAEGFGGWDDPTRCPVEFLEQLLFNQIHERAVLDPVDIGNFSMMLHHRYPETN